MAAVDWLSRLFEMVTVRGRLDLRCAYGTPWRTSGREKPTKSPITRSSPALRCWRIRLAAGQCS
jgi:hypothetical protein